VIRSLAAWRLRWALVVCLALLPLVVGVRGSAGATSSFVLTTASSTPSLRTPVTLTATRVDNGQPVPNLTVTFTVTAGPDAGQQGSGVTDGQGQATFTYTNNSATIGADTVSASFRDVTGGVHLSNSVTVTWVDNTAPTVIVPADFSVEATGPSGAIATFSVTATDPDDAAGPVSCAPASGSTFALGTTTVTCSSMDTHGNTGSASFQVTVQDTTPPVITVPADFAVEATGPSGAVVTYSVSATDLVDGTDPVSCSPASGSTFALGATTVSCTSTDAHGNTGSASFQVAVQDTTPPVITVPADFAVEATGPSGAVVTYSVSATDLVDGTDPVSCNPPSGSNFFIRTTPVTCTSTDAHGNTSTATFKVTVRDTTPPTLKVPGDLDVQASSPLGALVTFSVKATDTVDPDPSVACDPASGSIFPIGKTKVTCTAKDSSGNQTSKSFHITVAALQEGGGSPPPPPVAPPTPPPPLPPAIPAGSVNAKPIAGKTEPKVKLPGSNQYVPLSQAKQLPPGTTVNVSGNAAIQLSDANNHQMAFFGVADKVPSVFTIAGKSQGIVQLVLSGGNFSSCGHRTLSSVGAAKKKKPVRRLWGSGKGKFTTKGKFASATVRGTEWLVADYCNGTLVSVRKGLVSVRDTVQKKTKLVPAGHSYFAPSTAPPKKPKAKPKPKKK
jgi:HYR domain